MLSQHRRLRWWHGVVVATVCLLAIASDALVTTTASFGGTTTRSRRRPDAVSSSSRLNKRSQLTSSRMMMMNAFLDAPAHEAVLSASSTLTAVVEALPEPARSAFGAASDLLVAFAGVPEPEKLAISVGAVTVGAMAAGGLSVLRALEEEERENESQSSSAASTLSRDTSAAATSPYPNEIYDPDAAALYFARRPWRAVRRGFEIVGPAAILAARALAKKEPEAETARALVEALTKLGPTFIKIGQALSIRSDLLPPVYCDALATLQDAVPAFDTAEAKRIVLEELGLSTVDDCFVDFPDGPPIASASLGQVYQCRVKHDLVLRSGGFGTTFASSTTRDADHHRRGDSTTPHPHAKNTKEAEGHLVAVKVQRPDVTETIALDLFLLRTAAPVAKRLLRANTDLPGIVDAWGERFVDELDYRKEAKNAAQFSQSIAMTPLVDSVFAPAVLASCSSKKVLTTEWVVGKRLDFYEGDKVSALCSVAMNAYLTMMLESGLLHADPHPGNLIVEDYTNRLAILDWGLVTELNADLRVSYIEHIAHLVAKDYASVPKDLVKLGFVPAGYEEAIISSDAVKVLSDVYTQFAGGGGAKKIDVPEVLSELRALADRQGNLFQLPPYFAYIARAFSVLEGIGLTKNPDYAIVQECLPYVSQRLVTDPDPRVARALETFVYGASPINNGHDDDDDLGYKYESKSGREKKTPREEKRRVDDDDDDDRVKAKTTTPSSSVSRQVDATRLEYLLDGLGSFNAATSPYSADGDESAAVDDLVATLRRTADVLLADDPSPSPTQTILEREVAKLLGATLRSRAAETRDRPNNLALARLLDPFGLLEPLARGPLIEPSMDDKHAVEIFERVRTKASPQLRSALDAFRALPVEDRAKAAQDLAAALWDRRLGAAFSARRVAAELAKQTADRLLADTTAAASNDEMPRR